MIYVRLNSIKDSFGIYNYTIICSNSYEKLMDHLTRIFKPEEIDTIKFLHNPSKKVRESAYCIDTNGYGRK